MRVLLDANVLIRMLLRGPSPTRAVDLILEAALRRTFTCVVPDDVRREVARKVREKRYLTDRIRHDHAMRFLDRLEQSGEIPPIRFGPPAPISRDAMDDYLIGYAESESVDFLVTGDDDLLVLDGRFPFRVLTPADFLTVLREGGLV